VVSIVYRTINLSKFGEILYRNENEIDYDNSLIGVIYVNKKLKIDIKEVETMQENNYENESVEENLKRLSTLSKDELAIVMKVHEIFIEITTMLLSKKLDISTHIKLDKIESLQFSEYHNSIVHPSTVGFYSLMVSNDISLIEFDSEISFAIYNRLLGGQDQNGKLSQKLTEIEISIFETIMVKIGENLKKTWQPFSMMNFYLGIVESTPLENPANAFSDNDLILLTSFDVTIGQIKGKINIIYPFFLIKMTIEELLEVDVDTLGRAFFENEEKAREGIREILSSDHFLEESVPYETFQSIKNQKPELLVKVLQDEHPQTIAIIIYHLDKASSSAILLALPANIQQDVAQRIANIGKVSFFVIREIERNLERKLLNME